VEIIPQRGTFVTELTARDVAELFDNRLMIELYAAEHILKTGKVAEYLKNIREPMTRMGQAMVDDDYRDYEAFIDADRDLHLALVTLTDNQRLIRLYRDLHVHIYVARVHYMDSVEKARQAYREHEAMVKAFRDGKLEQVQQALRDHIGNVKERILEILEQHGGKL
jgi:DNA-binding GntR family transcriptional regulator